MASFSEKVVRFGTAVVELETFPWFIGYGIMIMIAGLWQRVCQPLSLRPVLVVYNFLCSALSLFTLIGFIQGLMAADHVYQKETSPYLTTIFFWYHITKRIELLDTVFMILRHRRRQISILHIFHHSTMLLLSEYSYRYSAWPAIAVILMLNSFVHVWLYLYYGLSALFPSNPPPWKQRLTELQIIQFFIDMVFAFFGYLHHGFCIYGFIYGFLMIYLFCNFYYVAYLKKKPSQPRKDKGV